MKAPCQYFGKCSGCTRQQLPYVKQLYDKGRQVKGALEHFATSADVFQAVVPSPLPFGYRTSSKLCLHEAGDGKRVIGLYERARKRVVAIPKCPVHHDEINRFVQKLFGKRPPPAPFYNHERSGFQVGRLKFLTIRYSPAINRFGAVLSHTGVAPELLEDWVKNLNLGNVCFYDAALVREDRDLVISRKVTYLGGEKHFALELAGHIYNLDPLAFFQANYALVDAFVTHITADMKGDVLCDLYGGFGGYSFPLAGQFQKIYLVEANERSVLAAKEKIQDQQFSHINAHAEGVERFLERGIPKGEISRVTHMIVNPPRTGLSPRVKAGLIDGKWRSLRQLTYVSCNLETLRRDLFTLVKKGGFKLVSVTPFDMFPQTDHIELVVKMRR